MAKHNANLSFGSVCSGIEAASCAWLPLGWSADWLSEIEPFPSAVLAYRHPGTLNLGDMTTIAARIAAGEVNAPDVLVGGTPCQAFSIAGLRGGLEDARGQLTLKYVELLNVIDATRTKSGHQPAISVWENVPGVLSSADNAFGCFLAGLAGEHEPFEPGQRPECGKSSAFWGWNKKTGQHIPKWSKSGWVNGRQRKVAWRILDAQYFGVAQRRRRLFVISSARTDIDPAAILFECEGLRRDTAPSRSAGQETASASGGGVKVGSHWDNPANPHPTLNQSHNTGGIGASNQEIFAQRGSGIISMAHGQGGAEINTDDTAPTLTCNHEAPIAVFAFAENTRGEVRLQEDDGLIAGPLSTGGGKPGQGYPAVANSRAIRRLTPVECERLQGFPDNWTLIPVEKRKKVTTDEYAYLRSHNPNMTAEEAYRLAADGPRYKAIGNSMAVPVMAWIGKRIDKAIRAASTAKSNVTHLRSVRAPTEFERPIFKWAGGKFSVMDVLNEHLPHGKRLIEPFVGGGSVFTNAGYKQNLLNDVNGHLINVYKMLQSEGHTLITLTHQYFRDYNTADAYLRIRKTFNEGAFDDLHLAAAFLFLNRHAFNGLVRYNLAGEFNVGYGKYKAPRFPLEEMEQFLGTANSCEFVSGDFAGVITQAQEGDVVFCDPPYEPMPGKNGFTSYSGHSFGFEEQERLVSLLVAAHKRGAKVLITNSGAPKIWELYRSNGFDIHQLQARRSVSCKSGSREIASDVLAKLGC
ncbi:Dam family site-specific DNA-(adenine-N6)-methyltransferase [Enterobacter hormaechei]|uniref:Dam family site-specific DNA-(adenine-N6)-methyltransferase n=1 Tax=Enterobacter hormaechei TaxID=158836 RepID=UPI003D6DE42A